MHCKVSLRGTQAYGPNAADVSSVWPAQHAPNFLINPCTSMLLQVSLGYQIQAFYVNCFGCLYLWANEGDLTWNHIGTKLHGVMMISRSGTQNKNMKEPSLMFPWCVHMLFDSSQQITSTRTAKMRAILWRPYFCMLPATKIIAVSPCLQANPSV